MRAEQIFSYQRKTHTFLAFHQLCLEGCEYLWCSRVRKINTFPLKYESFLIHRKLPARLSFTFILKKRGQKSKVVKEKAKTEHVMVMGTMAPTAVFL